MYYSDMYNTPVPVVQDLDETRWSFSSRDFFLRGGGGGMRTTSLTFAKGKKIVEGQRAQAKGLRVREGYSSSM